ncbi:MAG: right-handed parallel beta-helix repeat-containing protein [Candidatus Bathyarchaeota archaeon]|nr:right-handed parallel beta-helix repeat-containing protein [Candidatus Bathyarchaeota archaeon]
MTVGKKSVVFLVLFSLVLSTVFAIQPIKAGPRTIIVPDECSTINLAIANAADGDNIFVKKGNYTEVLVIDKTLSLRGEDKDATIINGGKAATVILIRHDNVEVSGFTIVYDATPNNPQSIWMWSTRLAGIHVLNAKNCKIFGNRVLDCGCGIWLYGASQNSVSDNYVARNDYGIRIEASDNNFVGSNMVTGNWGGMRLISAVNNTLRSNSMINNAQHFGVSSPSPSAYVNDVDASNTVDGKPVYYWVGVSNRAVPPDAGCVVLVNCVGVTAQGLSLSKNQDGIILVSTRGSKVSSNSVTECTGGIGIYGSFGDEVVGNSISSSVTGVTANGTGTRIISNIIQAGSGGIVAGGFYQTIAENTVSTGESGNHVIEVAGSYNNITRNRFTGTMYAGVDLSGSYNLVYENTITDCDAMRVWSNGNIIATNTITRSGIVIQEGSNNIMCANRITESYRGITVVFGFDNVCYGNHIENNRVGVEVGTAAERMSGNVFYHNNFVNNEQQVGKNWAKNTANRWDNGKEGNYWSDYTGRDQNFDGIGDTPYRVTSTYFDLSTCTDVAFVCGQDNYPLMAPFDISSATVELPEWAYSLPSTLPSSDSENASPIGPSPFAPSEETNSAPFPETEQLTTEPFPTATIEAFTVSAAIFGFGLLAYFKRYRRKTEDLHCC